MTRTDQAQDDGKPGKPGAEAVPLFGSWRRAYAIAITLFGVEIALLYLFTHYFS
jgi:hypothetical protein